jgi:hypothetical protein
MGGLFSLTIMEYPRAKGGEFIYQASISRKMIAKKQRPGRNKNEEIKSFAFGSRIDSSIPISCLCRWKDGSWGG